MELKTFITNTLLDITQGVEDANKLSNRFHLSGYKHSATEQSGQKIEFDLSIVVKESSENDINGGIKLAIFNLGAGTKTSESNQNIHKLKFDVFVAEK